MLNKRYNTITGTNTYYRALTDPRGMRVRLMYLHTGMLTVPAYGYAATSFPDISLTDVKFQTFPYFRGFPDKW